MKVYNVIDHLGQGNFGDVYLCETVHNKKKIVLKKIKFNEKADATKNEVAILKVLNHINVIDYFDSYIKDGYLHIIMEYATHGTLHDHIARHRPQLFGKEWVMITFLQILLGLDAIHKIGIMHRDLKSENIFLTGIDGALVKIADFGISKRLKNDEKTFTLIGTTNYLAPEVCDGEPYDMKSDIWSLGCILYELCAMERLFEGPMTKILTDIKSGFVKTINVETYGWAVQDIIQLAINVIPSLRPTTTQLLANAEIFPIHAEFIVNAGNYIL